MNWYVLYTKPRSEKKAAERLKSKGWEVYCPIKIELRQWSDRKKKVEAPCFPSYIFIRLENYEKQRVEVLYEPSLLNFVFWLGKPAILRDSEMLSIRKFLESNEGQEILNEQLTPGGKVVLGDGPFKGQTGVVEKILRNKVVLVIPVLQCQLIINK